jgi:hypothetical protein
MTWRRRFVELGWLAPALGFSALACYPITRNYFFSDDFLNLYQIVNDRLLQYLVTPNGGHLLLTRNAVFYLTFQAFGPHPAPYYWSAFLTHLVNVCLLFRLVRLTTGSTALASFGAALWGTSPLVQGTLGWYAVYGHVLVTTAVLVILSGVERLVREGRATPSSWMQWWWYALVLAAATSFGTGIAIALLLPVALLLLLPGWRGRSWRRPPLASLLVVLPGLYLALNALYGWLAGDHVLTRTPWLWFFSDPAEIVVFWVKLIALGVTRLVLAFWYPIVGGPSVWYAVLATLVATGIVVAWASPGPVRRRLAALALLVGGCYGIIAVARALLVLQIGPDRLAELSRYDYAAQALVTVALCTMLSRLAPVFPPAHARAMLVAWYGLTVVAYARLAPPIDHHDLARADTEQTLATIRSQIDAAPPRGPVFIPSRGFRPLPLLPTVFPGSAAVFVIFHPTNTTADGRPIRFVVQDPAVLAAGARGKRTRDLFVTSRERAAARAAAGVE